MNHEGIGLGLLICQNIVRENGGTISAHSEGPNKGATFCFSMDMRLKDSERRQAKRDKKRSKRSRAKPKLLKALSNIEEAPSVLETSN